MILSDLSWSIRGTLGRKLHSNMMCWSGAGYYVISMRDDFKTIYGPGVKKVDFVF